jgi:hypothetical protein
LLKSAMNGSCLIFCLFNTCMSFLHINFVDHGSTVFLQTFYSLLVSWIETESSCVAQANLENTQVQVILQPLLPE